MTYNDQIYKNVIRSLKELDMYDFIKYIETVNRESPKDDEKSIMWKEQCFINFPILYLASIYLYDYAKSLNYTTFLFATRDCCHWYKVFHKLYPNENIHYFHCSRNMFKNGINNPDFKKYVKSVVKDVNTTIFIDLHGTGLRMFDYFSTEFGKVPHCFLLSARYKDYTKFHNVSRSYYKQGKLINLVFDARGSPIEMLNYETIGTLQNYNKIGPIRDKLEYDIKLVKNYHTCIDTLLNKIPDPPNLNRDELHDTIKKIFKGILKEKPIISKYIVHIANHKKTPIVSTKNETLGNLNFTNINSKNTYYEIIWNDEYKIIINRTENGNN